MEQVALSKGLENKLAKIKAWQSLGPAGLLPGHFLLAGGWGLRMLRWSQAAQTTCNKLGCQRAAGKGQGHPRDTPRAE